MDARLADWVELSPNERNEVIILGMMCKKVGYAERELRFSLLESLVEKDDSRIEDCSVVVNQDAIIDQIRQIKHPKEKLQKLSWVLSDLSLGKLAGAIMCDSCGIVPLDTGDDVPELCDKCGGFEMTEHDNEMYKIRMQVTRNLKKSFDELNREISQVDPFKEECFFRYLVELAKVIELLTRKQ